jgi:GAF domain-containing protein
MEAAAEFFPIPHALCNGAHAGGELVGVMTRMTIELAGKLSAEDFVLLETLAAQLAASLLNLRLSALPQEK